MTNRCTNRWKSHGHVTLIALLLVVGQLLVPGSAAVSPGEQRKVRYTADYYFYGGAGGGGD